MIKVLIADDSSLLRSFLRQVFANDSRFCVVAEAVDGQKAVDACKKFSPDLVIMDINMPVMDGIKATKLIKSEINSPPVVIFSTENASAAGYDAIGAGAIEVIKKPEYRDMDETFFKRFCDKLAALGKKRTKSVEINAVSDKPRSKNYKILLIGASTGGPTAVQRVLTDLGSPFPIPILLTQHIDKTFDKNFAKWLTETTGQNVILAEEGVIPKAGTVYLAPAGKHLVMSSSGALHLSESERVHFLRPAVDPMFLSVAKVYANAVFAVLLTGMGSDGAEGCVDIKNRGGYTVAEAASTCVVFGMPKAAIMAGGASAILPLGEIGSFVKTYC
jgi:two-component system chemotaxis response regulator CheB